MEKVTSYDKRNDILFIHKGFEDEEFDGNLDIGDLILDMSTKGRVRGIEIMNASRFLEAFLSGRDLHDMTAADFTAERTGSGIAITINFTIRDDSVPAKIAVPAV